MIILPDVSYVVGELLINVLYNGFVQSTAADLERLVLLAEHLQIPLSPNFNYATKVKEEKLDFEEEEQEVSSPQMPIVSSIDFENHNSNLPSTSAESNYSPTSLGPNLSSTSAFFPLSSSQNDQHFLSLKNEGDVEEDDIELRPPPKKFIIDGM